MPEAVKEIINLMDMGIRINTELLEKPYLRNKGAEDMKVE